MILLFEGWEKVGKTTLALRTRDELNFQYFRSNKQINSNIDLEKAIKYDWRFMIDFLSQVNINICFDRSFISQYVYSNLFRKENILKNYSLEDYNNIFKQYCDSLSLINYKIIYCYRETYNNEIDDQVDITKVNEANNLYSYFFNIYANTSDILTCHYEDGIQYNIEKIKQEIK